MTKLFISHSSKDDNFVRELRVALANHGLDSWIDSRELCGGDPLWPEIQKAIDVSDAFAVLVSPASFQSKWVGDELAYAIELQKTRGKEKFPVIPLLLNGAKLGVFNKYFIKGNIFTGVFSKFGVFNRGLAQEPITIPVSSEAGGVDAAINPLLVVMRMRLPADVASTPQPKAELLEDLVLELTDLKFHEQDGVRRASARARLVYEPATPGQPDVHSVQSWRFVVPIGPIEAEELRWYLEKYAIWPSHYFRDRARKVEENIVTWGKLLHEAALPIAHTSNVMRTWEKINDHAGRRFSVHVDSSLEAGVVEADLKSAKEVATLLLGLPWELLHDGDSYLFQGAKPTRVRRRLPNTKSLDVQVVETPIRILLVSARPEDELCGYIDHRVSALPLVEAMESLPGLVKLHVLNPPTLPALRAELDRARDEKKPYHVVHFDGHGVYDKTVGLGGLCFEKPEDASKLEKRGHVTVYTSELGPLLRDHRIPLVFLEACQTALADKASESVASELLKVGVASVVAMSHSVLVESARRFVEAFYKALAGGKRVGDAMLAGQRCLKDDTFRGRIFGAGELRLEDWFVPVLFQEKDDPQLFKAMPAKQTQEDFKTALAARLGKLPKEPETGFIGRSSELLAFQRLLRSGEKERYAVVRGQGGEGKTALAAEFARWMVRSHQLHRIAFVSVETDIHVAAVLDALGRQLVGKDYSVATFENLEKAIQPVERALREQSTLLVVDNMESILLPPFLAEDAPEALTEDASRELDAILKLGERLNAVGETRLIFTSRELLPAPFDAARNQRPLHQLDRDDAVKLVERALNAAGGAAGASSDAAREEIEQLVDAVHCHARTLALLAPALQKNGVETTRLSLVELMVEMERKFPGSREQSVFASVELSLRRMSAVNRERVKVLGVFHGGVYLGVLKMMMQREEEDVASLAAELVKTGLATVNSYNYLMHNPALSPYLFGRMEASEQEELTARWYVSMSMYVDFLQRQESQNAEVAAKLTLLDVSNLFELLDFVRQEGEAKLTIHLATILYSLLSKTGKIRLLEWVGMVRDDAARELVGEDWSYELFEAALSSTQQQFENGPLSEALIGAKQLLNRARLAGVDAYLDADYDLARCCHWLARVLRDADGSEEALKLLDEAQQLFETVEKRAPGKGAERMMSVCVSEQGACFLNLGRFEDAATAFNKRLQYTEKDHDERGVAIAKGSLGIVFMELNRPSDALKFLQAAAKQFEKLGEPETVADYYTRIGELCWRSNQPKIAEVYYIESLKTYVRLKKNNKADQVNNQLKLLQQFM